LRVPDGLGRCSRVEAFSKVAFSSKVASSKVEAFSKVVASSKVEVEDFSKAAIVVSKVEAEDFSKAATVVSKAATVVSKAAISKVEAEDFSKEATVVSKALVVHNKATVDNRANKATVVPNTVVDLVKSLIRQGNRLSNFFLSCNHFYFFANKQ